GRGRDGADRGVTLGFDPVLIQLGSLAVRPFGLLSLIGFGLGVWLALVRAGEDRKAALSALAWAVPAGVLSARATHVLGWWEYYLTRPFEIWQLGIDGLSLWGGLAGGALVAARILRHDPALRRRVFDVAARAV